MEEVTMAEEVRCLLNLLEMINMSKVINLIWFRSHLCYLQ